MLNDEEDGNEEGVLMDTPRGDETVLMDTAAVPQLAHDDDVISLLKQFHKAPANQKASKQIKRHQSKVCGCWKSGVTATFARRLLKATKP